MMKKKKLVTIKIISFNGHDEIQLPVKQAVAEIKRQCKEENKWAYLDMDYINPETIVEKNLLDAEEIMLTHQVAGGN